MANIANQEKPHKRHPNPEDPFSKMAKRKTLFRIFLGQLIRHNWDSSKTVEQQELIIKQYLNSYGCRNFIATGETSVKRLYSCKKRWCPLCNAVRAMQTFIKYAPYLKALQPMYHVVLTLKTCTAEELYGRLKEMQKVWHDIHGLARKNKLKDFIGMRKLEVHPSNNNPKILEKEIIKSKKKDNYHRARSLQKILDGVLADKAAGIQRFHPHLHILIKNRSNARWLRQQWLKRWGEDLAIMKGQHLSKTKMQEEVEGVKAGDDTGGLLELFKYVVKPVSGKDGTLIPSEHFCRALHVVFKSLQKHQTLFAFGNLKKVPIPDEDKEIDEIDDGALIGRKISDKQANKLFVFAKEQMNFIDKENEAIALSYFDINNPEHIKQKDAGQIKTYYKQLDKDNHAFIREKQKVLEKAEENLKVKQKEI